MITGDELERSALVVQHHVDDEITAGPTGDPGVLFVDRITVQDTAVGAGIFQKSRTVPLLDRFDPGDARTDQFAATREAGHQMRLDQPDRHLQIGLHVTRVDPDGHTTGTVAQIGVFLGHLTVVVLDAVLPRNLGTEDLDQFVAFVGTMQTGGDQDQNVLAGNPRLFQRLQHRRQNQRVGNRTRDVADDDAGTAPARGQLPERGRLAGMGQDLGQRNASGPARVWHPCTPTNAPRARRADSTSRPSRPYSNRTRMPASPCRPRPPS